MPEQNTDYDIVGGYNNERVTSIDAERSVNLFVYIDPKGKKPKALLPTSGLSDSNVIYSGATGGFRNQFVFNNNVYQVIGANVYLLNDALSPSLLGTLTTTTGHVGIDANNATNPQVIFVDGEFGYIWDTIAQNFQKITDTSFPTSPIDVTYLDGFFVVADGGTNLFQLSMLNQGFVWGVASNTFTADSTTDLLTISGGTANYITGVPITFSTTGTLPAPLNSSDTYYSIQISPTTIKVATTFANAVAQPPVPIDITTNGTGTNTISGTGQLQQGEISSHPGNIVACRCLHRQLFLFSEFYTEVWENAGIGTNLPFRRNNGLLMEYGTPAIGSVTVGFDMMFFLSQTRDGLGSVMQVTGSNSIPVSMPSLDYQLSLYAANPTQGVADCTAQIIKENGIIFCRMNFTLANHTFVYNVTMSAMSQDQIWHEEEQLNGDRSQIETHAYFNGINYVGDYNKPLLYSLSSQHFTNNGVAIRRMRIGRPFIVKSYQRIRVDRLQVDLLQGSIDNLVDQNLNVDLLTENGFILETENGIDIITEQVIPSPIEQILKVFLSLSKDSGQTFGYEIQSPMGRVGNRSFRTVWRKLGTFPRGQAFVPKFQFFNNAPFVILGAAWVFEVMPE